MEKNRLFLIIALVASVALLAACGGGVATLTPAASADAPEASSGLGIGSKMISDKDGMEMVYVPAGKFLMGSAANDAQASSDEKPQHKVYLDAFWIDKTEVTNAQFARFVTDTAYKTEAEKVGTGLLLTFGNWEKVKGADWRHPLGPGSSSEDSHPAVQVSWDDAKAYCEWAGRRLPTEAEWEKAARGMDGRVYPGGNDAPDAKSANFGGNLGAATAVGSYPAGASPYGALDMAGNVREWVGDWFDGAYYADSPASNPSGPATGDYRVLRGGSWFGVSSDVSDVRATYRVRGIPELRSDGFGFRCARSL